MAVMFVGLQTFAQTYTYDNLNRLTKVVYDNGTTVAYTYDELGNRTSKKVTGATVPKGAYAWLSSDGKTLTFCYDDQRAQKNGNTYDLNSGSGNPEWNLDPWNKPSVATSVVFESSFAQARPTSTDSWFLNFDNLTEIQGIKYLNTTEVTTMNGMFRGCKQLMSLDLSHFNTSNVTNMSNVFDGCSALTSLDLSNFSTSNLTSSRYMLRGCYSLKELSVSSTMNNLDENACENVGERYSPCTLIAPEGFNFGVDTSGARFTWKSGYFRLSGTIFTVSAEELELKKGETERVQLIAGYGDYSISNSHPNVVKVELDGEEIVVAALGQGTSIITITDNQTQQQVSIKVKVIAPTTMKVEPMSISFEVPKGTSKTEFFTVYNTGDGTLTFHLDYSTMDGIFDVLEGEEEYVLDAGESKKFTLVCSIPGDYQNYGGGMALRIYSNATNWDNNNDWINVGFTPTEPDTKMAYAVFKDGTLTFYYDSQKNSRDENIFDLNDNRNDPAWYSVRNKVTRVVFDASFVEARPTTTYKWFYDMSGITAIEGMQYLNTSKVTDMYAMFSYCAQLTSLDLSTFDTSNVMDMRSMFEGCSSLKNIVLSSFDTSNVTDMASMFMDCGSLTSLDLSNFDTSKVKWFFQMFDDCSSLTILDVSNFDTSSAFSMSTMFGSCTSLTALDLSNFNTSNVEYMSQMFWACVNLRNIDVSHFDTHKVQSMRGMFNYCRSLTSLDVSNFDTSNVIESDMLFNQCYSLSSLSISSTMGNIHEASCSGVGNTSSPCALIAPEGFIFGVDTSCDSFVWKSGTFKLTSSGIHGLLDFSQLQPYSHVEVYDATGKLIKTMDIGANPQPLDLNGLGVGIFIINVNGVTNKIVRKGT